MSRQSRTARRVAVAIGTTIEWYDFFISGAAAATVFGPRFFPHVSPLAAATRYSGASLSNALGTILGGAPAPFIAAASYDRFGSSLAVGAYIAMMAMVSWLPVLGLRETQPSRSQ